MGGVTRELEKIVLSQLAMEAGMLNGWIQPGCVAEKSLIAFVI